MDDRLRVGDKVTVEGLEEFNGQIFKFGEYSMVGHTLVDFTDDDGTFIACQWFLDNQVKAK